MDGTIDVSMVLDDTGTGGAKEAAAEYVAARAELVGTEPPPVLLEIIKVQHGLRMLFDGHHDTSLLPGGGGFRPNAHDALSNL